MTRLQTHTKPRVLVTSAAGRTAAPAVLDLLEKGFPVRAFVRRDDSRAEVLRNAGAEIFVGNLFDLRDLRKALVDVQRAYYCPPLSANLLHGAVLFALAAEEAKLEAVALMSQWNPHPTHPSATTREHWMVNNVGSSQGSVQLWPVPWLISQALSSTYVAGEHRLYLERNCRLSESPAHGTRRKSRGACQCQGAEQSARVRPSGKTSAKVQAAFHECSWFVAL